PDDLDPVDRLSAPGRAGRDPGSPDRAQPARVLGRREMTSRLMFRVLGALVAFTVLARIPVGFDVGFKFDSALAVIWAFGLLSLVLLTGYVGQISLCQATFAGVGAYATGLMVAGFHTDYLVAVGVGVAAA